MPGVGHDEHVAVDGEHSEANKAADAVDAIAPAHDTRYVPALHMVISISLSVLEYLDRAVSASSYLLHSVDVTSIGVPINFTLTVANAFSTLYAVKIVKLTRLYNSLLINFIFPTP